MHKVSTFTQLTYEERIKIEVLFGQGWSYSAIARVLHRPVSTVSREVKRNGSGRNYKACAAQHNTEQRHRQKQKHTVFDEGMKRYISDKLREFKWSPELISVMGKKQCCEPFISYEWIYRWIWQMKFSQKKADRPYRHLYEHLRHAHRRRSRSRKRHNRGNILKRTWIEERPKIVDKRKRTGDLEADIVLGLDRKPGLLVAVDRRTRKMWLRKLPRKDAPYVSKQLHSIARTCGGVRTITLDNDQSFARHYELHKLGIQTYFTHPYSSQEKGSVENRIGLIRMFFSKQTDFSKVSHQQIKKVEQLLNQRPLRMFNYKSPNEMFQKHPPPPLALMS